MTLSVNLSRPAFADAGYVADGDLATALPLMALLQRPLLLEGEAGVGKTEVAKALAAVHDTALIRLQCYEGLDQSAALYEWNYQRQLLAIQAQKGEVRKLKASTSRTRSFPKSTCSSVRCSRPSARNGRRCC